MINQLARYKQIFKRALGIGIPCTVKYLLLVTLSSVLPKFRPSLKGKLFSLRVKEIEHTVLVRLGTSDLDVFKQIFIQQEYKCLNELKDPALILDCGANVGYSSIYFLNKFPTAHVIAIEPDSGNYATCYKNLLPYGQRITTFNSGIWSDDVGLVVCREQFGDGREWAIQVRECGQNEEPDIKAVSIGSLLKQSGFSRVDILKVDIERSEIAVFSNDSKDWLERINNIVIELHGPDCEEAFFAALSQLDYELSSSGELTVCKSIKTRRKDKSVVITK